ncbi:MAG: type II toxin-antitoxin system PemK/MazF family toxin [Solirubrobacterales bacterium]
MSDASQGEVWFCELDPTRGREQAGRRPVAVISVDQLGTGPSGLAIVVPLTTTPQDNPIRPTIDPPEGGLRERSWALADMVRSVDRSRLAERWGRLRPQTVDQIAARVRLLIRT